MSCSLVAPCHKLALRSKTTKLRAKSQNTSPYSFRDFSVYTDRLTEGQTDMARSTWLAILIENIYILCGRKGFLHTFRRI